MMAFRPMRASLRLLVAMVIWACAVSAQAATDATLFRLFLKDGSALVSYGEFTRVQDRVVFSMPVGGSPDEPRLQVVWISAASVDWPRTDRYSESARYQHYADTKGEEDFAVLNNEVAQVLNDIALSTNRARALAIATQARAALAEWPRQHHGYRQDEVREIVALIDESIANLRSRRRSHQVRRGARGLDAAVRWSRCSACRRSASSWIRCCGSPPRPRAPPTASRCCRARW